MVCRSIRSIPLFRIIAAGCRAASCLYEVSYRSRIRSAASGRIRSRAIAQGCDTIRSLHQEVTVVSSNHGVLKVESSEMLCALLSWANETQDLILIGKVAVPSPSLPAKKEVRPKKSPAVGGSYLIGRLETRKIDGGRFAD